MSVAESLRPDELERRYKEFILNFVDNDGEAIYRKKVADLLEEKRRSLSIDWWHLYSTSSTRDLAEDLIVHPSTHVEAASKALRSIVMEQLGDLISEDPYKLYTKMQFHVRFYNLPSEITIRELSKYSVGRLVEIEGIVTRTSDIYDMLVKAVYVCNVCGNEEVIDVAKVGKFKPPDKCSVCGAERSFRFDPEKSEFIRWQVIRVQERPEDLPPGMMPKHVDAILYDDLVDEVKPGDRVKLSAIIKLMPARVKEDKTAMGPIFKRYLEIVHIEVPNKVYEKLEITPEDEERIFELSKRSDLEDLIIKSIAPSIHGWEHVKRAIAYSLFGGNPQVLPDGTKVRGEINILLVGDPGVAKCISGGEYVITEKGLISAEDLFSSSPGDLKELDDGVAKEVSFKVLSLNGEGELAWTKARAIAKRRPLTGMVEVLTDRGLKLKVTTTHPFLTIREGRLVYVSAQDLKKGDYIASIGYFKSLNGEEGSPEEEGLSALLGFLITSRVKHNSFYLTINEEAADYLEKIIDKLRKFGYKFKISRRREGTRCKVTVHLQSGHELSRFLSSSNRYNRAIPLDLLLKNKRNAYNFVKSLIISAGKRRRRSIILPSFGRKGALQIYIVSSFLGLLPKLERAGSLYRVKFSLKGDGLDISSIRSIDDSKIPGIGEAIRSVRRALGLSHRDLGVSRSQLSRIERNLSTPSRSFIVNFLNKVMVTSKEIKDLKGELITIMAASSPSIVWDKVVEVKSAPEESWVYDVEVRNYNNFAASGLIVHNSQLLKYVAQISPRGLYTTGKGSTAAGLTAAVVRDSSTGGWTLEAGALVLADRGVACIDEFDKMSEDDRRAIHEAMEQQTISIAKAGIVATLNARTTVIAASNPKKGRYDPYESVADNINLPPTILSRFDLVFIMRDIPDKMRDKSIAEHILDTRRGKNPEAKPPIEIELLKKYIAYAKQNIRPILTEEAADEIMKFYIEMREKSGKISSEEGIIGETIAITPRQLEALIRLSEARAKLHLRNEVTANDAKAAIELMMHMLSQVGYDFASGAYDITGFMTGVSYSKVKRKELLVKIINELSDQFEDGLIDRDVLVKEASERLSLPGEVVEQMLGELKGDGVIYEPEPGRVKLLERE